MLQNTPTTVNYFTKPLKIIELNPVNKLTDEFNYMPCDALPEHSIWNDVFV